VFNVDGVSSESATPQGLIDPDGHRLVISASIDVSSPTTTLANAGSSPGLFKPE